MSSKPSVSAVHTITGSFAALFKPPFRVLAALSVLITATSSTFEGEISETQAMLFVVLLIASLYVEMAIILASGRDDPEPSADAWLRGAFRRRCFWRFVGTTLLVVAGLFAGTLLLVVGILFVGALLALALPASVVERRLPMDAIGRGAKVANPARFKVGTVFAFLVLIPNAVPQTIVYFDESSPGEPWFVAVSCVAQVAAVAGLIALTRLFVVLGGSKTPSPEHLSPKDPGAIR